MENQTHNLRYLTGSSISAEFSPEEQEILAEVNQRIAALADLESLIDYLFDSTEDIFPCDRIGVAFIEEGGARIISHYNRCRYEPVLLKSGFAQDLGDSSLGQVLKSGQPRIIGDLEAYAGLKPSSPSTRILLKEGVRSSMTCPLLVEGRIVGLLFRSSRRVEAYGPHQVALHLAVAERLSQAVEKAYRIQQLAQANQAYNEMLGFVVHELKSPLASMIMDAQLLTGGFVGELNPEQKERVERLTGKGRYLLDLIGEYLNLAHLESGTLKKRTASVDFRRDVLSQALDILAPQREEKQISLEVNLEEGLTVECDPSLMKIVMVNLIGNGIKYSDERGTVRITGQMIGGNLEVRVWNTGPGFSRDQRSLLFRKFSRLQSRELSKRKGTGVGLYTTWRIIQLHNGWINAASEEGSWAEFFFQIPAKG